MANITANFETEANGNEVTTSGNRSSVRSGKYGVANLQTEFPNIYILRGGNLTSYGWEKEEFRNQRYTKGWTGNTVDKIPGWDNSRKLVGLRWLM